MAVETDTERAIFVEADDFGVSVTYTPSGGDATTIEGLFDSDFQEVDAGGAVTFAVSVPRLLTLTSNVSNAAEGDSVTIASVDYVVLSVFDDGQGMTELRLEKQ